MNKRRILYTLSVVFLFIACSCESDLRGDQVEIRIKNISQYDFLNVRVNTNGGENSYGDIASRKSSEYKVFEFAYRYAFVELNIGVDTFTLQPIDYVGEELLASGRYTYAIDATSNGGKFERLSLVLVED